MLKQRVYKIVADAFVGSNLVGKVEATMVASITSESSWADGKLHFLEGPTMGLAGERIQLVFVDDDIGVEVVQQVGPVDFSVKSSGRLPLAWI